MDDKYENTENKKTVKNIVIRIILGIIISAVLLIWLTGEAPKWFYLPTFLDILMPILMITVFAVLLYKPVSSLPWHKPLILNACLGGAFVLLDCILAILLVVPLFLLAMMSFGDSQIAESMKTVGKIICLLVMGVTITANHVLYSRAEKLPEDEQYSFFKTLLFVVLNCGAFALGGAVTYFVISIILGILSIIGGALT